MDRLERLVNLVAALLEAPRPLLRDEIRVRVPGYAGDEVAFRRTFERDKESIRQMGIPLSIEQIDPTTPDRQEGYRIRREHYELPDPGLHGDELAALHLAASAVRVEGTAGTEALWKLGGAPDAAAPPTSVALPGGDDLAPLFGAIAERRRVSFRYRGEERELNPYQLSFRNGHWYLQGFDHGRGESRLFRLDRFETPAIPGDATNAFERPAGAGHRPVKPWEMGDGDTSVVAHLLVDAGRAEWAVADTGPDAVSERRDDGSVVLELAVANRAAFRSFALGFLEHAEVLDPPELRHEMIDWLQALAGGTAA